ncbi:MAG: hypothetical protein ACOYXC_10410 [Candidatus Rifleibacteriota bacterium]
MNGSGSNISDSGNQRSESGFSIQTLLIVLLLMYFLLPWVFVAPVQKAFGTVPRFVEIAFIPVEFLYNRSKIYRDYVDLQAKFFRVP